MFRAARDAVTSKAAQRFLNQKLARYGEVQTLRIDSHARQMEVVCRLLGESEPVTVRVEEYQLAESGGRKIVRIGQCSCSRPWLQNLLNDFAQHREIPLPSWAASAL